MWSAADASPARLSELALQLDASGRWRSFLSPQEYQLFVAALHGAPETWERFLNGRIPCRMRVSQGEDARASVDVVDVDPAQLALRVRYMLWDSMLSGSDSGHSMRVNRVPTPTETTSSAAPTANAGDSDYDESDDEPEPLPPIKELVIDTKPEDLEPDAKGRALAVHNASQMYDTFEQDAEQLRVYKRLKDSDQQIQDGDTPEPAAVATAPTLLAKHAGFGSANLCLKYLLAKVEANRDVLPVSDNELRVLISDVRRNRSKWASEDRIGQEELYEACERVVMELRGTTEHSTPFLNKVSKRDAPNYYDVIKTPMDLNTVMRKLRLLQYDSKQSFLDDLNLIWTNCLTYNSDPRHFLRAHAIAMRKKTQALAPLIPDVVIMLRADVEAQAEQQSKKRRHSEPVSSKSQKGQKRKVTNAPVGDVALANDEEADADGDVDGNGETGSQRASAQPASAADTPAQEVVDLVHDMDDHMDSVELETNTVRQPEHAEAEEPATATEGVPSESEPLVSESAAASTGQIPTDSTNTAAPSPALASAPAAPNATADDRDASMAPSEPDSLESRKNSVGDKEEEYAAPDVESAFWDSATRKSRTQLLLNRRALFRNNELQMGAPVIARSPLLMLQFERVIAGAQPPPQQIGLALPLQPESLLDAEEPFLVEYMVNAGMPAPLASPPTKEIVPKLEELPSSRYIARGVLNELVLRNLNDMQMIRRLCTKILYVKDLQTSDFQPADPNMTAYVQNQEFAPVSDPEEDVSSRLPNAARFDQRASTAGMQRSVAKMAMLAGFQATETHAIDLLTAIACDYMMKLARTLKANLEAPRSSASFASVVGMSLAEMGVPKLGQLTAHISSDILRRGRRFSRFKQRLNHTLVELLRPEVERYKDEQFADNSEQFVLGQFSSELGDDYFGFKDLGLDKELGVANIAIPFHLLQQRVNHNGPRVLAKGAQEESCAMQEYPPLSEELVEALPQILRPAFAKYIDELRASSSSAPLQELLAKNAAAANSARAKIPANVKPGSKKRKFALAFVKSPPPAAPPKSDPESKFPAATTPAQETASTGAPPEAPSGVSSGLNKDAPPAMSVAETEPEKDSQILQDDMDLFGEDDLAKNGFSLDDGIGTTSLLL